MRGQQAHRPQSGDQTAAPMKPVGSRGGVGAAHSLHAQGLIDRFLDDGKRFHQDPDRLQFGRHPHDVLLLIDHVFGLVSVQSTDASLAVLAGLAHVGAVHQAGGAFAASPPYGEHSVVAGLHASDRRAHAHHLAEHFVPDDEFGLAIRGLRAASGYLFPVGAADAHSYDADFDFVRLRRSRLGPLHQARTGCARNNSDCFQEFFHPFYDAYQLRTCMDPSRSSKWSPTRSAFAMMVRLGFTAAIDTKKLASTT